MDRVQAAVADMFKPKYFNNNPKKGETFELKAELNADTKDKRKDAVKKVIANMTVGKDVSMLFADVVKNMQTEDLELKKLVYLYLINYAKTQPELVILAINTFVKDVDDPNPLIRALAMRTMGCLRVQKVIDYICDPLKKTLKDDHPYVRKTAAICVAKLHDLDPQLAHENGFLFALQDLLADPNPMVVANAVTALVEIRETSNRKDVFLINVAILQKLLIALNECTEWGQISILEAIALYTPNDAKEAEAIVERVLPRLQHVNASVVLSAIKVMMILLDFLDEGEFIRQLIKKMAPPLVTLLTAPAEVQYVALRNINLILQKRPEILANEMRVFFCKYNDPPYVKLEKLEVMIKLSSESNIDQVISELKEYANEVDVDFVRKAVQAIGRCAIKIDVAAERCVAALLDLIKNKVNYVVQEGIIVIKDIFRKYPNRYEAIIPALCENLDSLDEPEAKAAMIWIVGEYAQRIENANELVEYFMENFKFEPPQVQLQLLTTTVKLFLKKPSQAQDLVQKVLQTTTTTGESADLRDRAYIYWRLLSTDPNAAKAVVLAEKPPIADEVPVVNSSLLNELIRNLATIASVYHKPASTFLTGRYAIETTIQTVESEDELGNEGPPPEGMPYGMEMGVPDVMGGAMAVSPPGFIGFAGIPKQSLMLPKTVFLQPQTSKGLELSGTFVRKMGISSFLLTFTNKALAPMTDFAIQFNKNSFGIIPAGSLSIPHPIPPNQSIDVALELDFGGSVQKMEPVNLLQVAVKNSIDVFYFQTTVPLYCLLLEDGFADRDTFMNIYEDTSAPEKTFRVNGHPDFLPRLDMNNIFLVHKETETVCFMSAVLVNGMIVLAILSYDDGPGIYEILIKTKVPELLPLFEESLRMILTA